MSSRAQQLYQKLSNAAEIVNLIGQTEDVHFDCKVWPERSEDARASFAKAVCGLTNAEGGILVIGMKAKVGPNGEPDVVQAAAPVPDTTATKSKVLELIGQLVEPGIEGIEIREIAEAPGTRSGFLVVLIPASEGPPRRSRKDWKFYLRIGSGTFPMEYFQIEDAFGARPHPRLELFLGDQLIRSSDYSPQTPVRVLVLGLSNAGRGIAKFPGIRFRQSLGLSNSQFGIDGNHGFGIPLRPSEAEWITFRGGVDDVIYPGETHRITRLTQSGENRGIGGMPNTQEMIVRYNKGERGWYFKAIGFSCEISCEGAQTFEANISVPEHACVF